VCLILLITKRKWWADALKKGKKETASKKEGKKLGDLCLMAAKQTTKALKEEEK
jgi:hypothetical protein